jgi:NAD(P)-dependent dehydrogenase (short-subunit alcohol dehydrogenase family)
LAWQPSPLAAVEGAAGGAAGPGWWLLFADSRGVSERLEALLDRRGEWSWVVRPGGDYGVDGERRLRIDPRRPDHFVRLLREAGAGSRRPCRGIVDLWALDAAPTDRLSLSALDEALTAGPASLLWIVQALAHADWERMIETAAEGAWRQLPRVWAVTRGAQAVAAGERVAVAQAPMWGLGRVVARENPEIWAGLVDLDPRAEAAAAAARLLAELDAARPEAGVAYRDGERHTATLQVGGGAVAGGGLRFRPDASYLITGGFGGLGLATARWLADRGARRLVLAGRGGLPPRERWADLAPGSPEAARAAAVRDLEALGVSVHPETLDVADEGRLQAFLDRFRREGWPPIRGVVHAAGALADQLLARMSREDFDVAWRPKVVGSWLLHDKLRDQPLDFFVLYSSVAAVLGTFGQGNYAAANAFLDALAHDRQAVGLPAVSVDWGPWSEVGMAARMDPASLAAQGGIELISPAEGLAYLGRAMAGADAQVLAARADWRRWAQAVGSAGAARLVADLGGDGEVSPAEPGAAAPRGTYSEEVLAETDPTARRARIERRLIELCGTVARLEPAQIDPHLPLPAVGFDSILTAEIRGQIKTHFGVEIPLTGMLLGASITRIAEQIQAALEGAAPDMDGDAARAEVLAGLSQA